MCHMVSRAYYVIVAALPAVAPEHTVACKKGIIPMQYLTYYKVYPLPYKHVAFDCRTRDIWSASIQIKFDFIGSCVRITGSYSDFATYDICLFSSRTAEFGKTFALDVNRFIFIADPNIRYSDCPENSCFALNERVLQ